MKISDNFTVDEFVQRELYEKYGPTRCLQFVDPRIVKVAQEIRNILGTIVVINNWKVGGTYNESGLRSPGDQHYSQSSQHSFGRAIDIKSPGMMAINIYNKLKENFAALHKLGATTLEDIRHTPGWVHIDCREWGEELKEFKIVSPKKSKG